MGRKEITTKEDLMKVIELFENTGITYWLDGGWGVDILAGKQTRIHSGKEILWMVGSRMNERYKINPQTRKVLVLNYQGGYQNE